MAILEHHDLEQSAKARLGVAKTAIATTLEQTRTGPGGVLVPVGTETANGIDGRGQKARAMLRARLGEDIYTSWFNALEFDRFDGRLITVSVPVKFLRNWI